MNTIKITTSQNIDVEYELGSLGDRIVGAIIDWVILIAYMVLFFSILGFTHTDRFIGGNSWIIIIFMIPVIFYDLLSELLLNGQSVGKKVMGIRVISLSGQQPSFGQYLMRWLFRLIDFSITSYILGVISIAVTNKKQRLGDIIAGTTLVKTTPRTHFQNTLYQPIDSSTYHVTYPEVIQLKDSDIQLIKEVMLAVNRTGNTMLALEAQRKIEQTLQIMSKQPEPREFLPVILADYNYLTSQL